MSERPKEEKVPGRLSSLRPIVDIAATVLMMAAAVAILYRLSVGGSVPLTPSGRDRPLPTAPIDFSGSPVTGSDSAPLVMVVFSDFECPFCRTFAAEVFPDVKASYVDTGRLQVAYLHLPLSRIHPNSIFAANLSACAQEKGRFWPVHDRLFMLEKASVETIRNVALEEGLTDAAFSACVDAAVHPQVAKDIDIADQAGIRSTPTILLGRRRTGSEMLAARRLDGARPLSDFHRAIDSIDPGGGNAGK